jgi:phosphate transport system substrate-binding protein
MNKTKLLIAAGAATLLAACGTQSTSRDQIRAVGSSTVYPFAKAAAESLARSDATIKAPIIESTGTGAGMKLFCAGIGPQHLPRVIGRQAKAAIPQGAMLAWDQLET